MLSNSIRRTLICAILLSFGVLSALLGVTCYDKIAYPLNLDQNIITYAESNYGIHSKVTDQINLRGITLVGIIDGTYEYKVLGYIKSPISARYKSEPIEYSIADYSGKGLICMLTPKGFTYSFNFSEATNENVNNLNMHYPYYFIFLYNRDGVHKIDLATDTIRASSWPIWKTQLIPYLAIILFFILFWAVVYLILQKKIFNKWFSN